MMLKNILETSSEYFSSEQPFEKKNLEVVLDIAGVEKKLFENLWLRSTLEALNERT